MKLIKLISFAVLLLSSCTKTPHSSNVNTTGYDCHCYWFQSSGKDTTTEYYYSASTGLQGATNACTVHDKSVKGSGSGAYCRIY